MANVLILDAFRAQRVTEKLHGKSFAFLDTNERYAALRAEHADMQARAARFSVTDAPSFLKSSVLEPLRNQRVRGKAVQQVVAERMHDAERLPAYLSDGLARHGLKLTTQSTYKHRQPGVLVDLRCGGAVERLYVAEGFSLAWRDMVIADADALIVDPTDPRLTPSGRFYAFAFYRV
ncbi:hypothetical protein C0Z18_31900 [Trinickia dabaoshanensis]|uniref:Uncharacterized protein n=2 Tax=Trinickia dabaoshanensis TaxID=564714 RepID=A0A2N7VB71_9BURK|nr:hypothetical protein C0Z18_31900 [Trinickia dabaoshanensis]